MVSKSGGPVPTQKLDFELDLVKHPQVATLWAYAEMGLNEDCLPVVSLNIEKSLDALDLKDKLPVNTELGNGEDDDLPAYPSASSKRKSPRYL